MKITMKTVRNRHRRLQEAASHGKGQAPGALRSWLRTHIETIKAGTNLAGRSLSGRVARVVEPRLKKK